MERITIPDVEFVDRYDGHYPDLATVCPGQCEGMGCVPVRQDDPDPAYRALWKLAHQHAHTITARVKAGGIRALLKPDACDGTHFVPCIECGGTGKRSPA